MPVVDFLEVVLQLLQGLGPDVESETVVSPGEDETQELGRLALGEIPGWTVLVFERESGLVQDFLDLLKDFQAFGRGSTQIRQVVGVAVPEPRT
ncbi:MAG: hypothetical protein JWO38_3636 [Gemmataceae bacterium]|nr:hypothetical protein [Gemmataceae bacterium]